MPPLALDDKAYRAMSARARQFAEYMFSPQSVAVATRAVYTSLLARDGAEPLVRGRRLAGTGNADNRTE